MESDPLLATVSLRGVRKSYDAQEVVHGIDLEVADQEFVVLVGPSGCGKSTLLRMIAGLEDISSGAIAIAERVVNEIDPKDRDVAMVFQDYALYPHLTVFQKLGERVRTTAIYVTNDQIEAMTLADRIVLMHNGRVEQIGTPEDVYEAPATLFVAGFIGASAMNLVAGRVENSAGACFVNV